MTLDELTAYLEKQGFTRNVAEPESQTEPEQQNNFATKDDLTALQTAIADLTNTIKANAIITNTFDKPDSASADDILGAVLSGKTGGKET